MKPQNTLGEDRQRPLTGQKRKKQIASGSDMSSYGNMQSREPKIKPRGAVGSAALQTGAQAGGINMPKGISNHRGVPKAPTINSVSKNTSIGQPSNSSYSRSSAASKYSPLAGTASYFSNSANRMQQQSQDSTDLYQQGVRDYHQRKRDLYTDRLARGANTNVQKLTAEFNNFKRGGGKMDFVDWMQGKIDTGELNSSDPAVTVFATNYEHQFQPGTPGNAEYQQQAVTATSAFDREIRARREAREARREEGLRYRQQRARQQADISSAVARYRAAGLSPQGANAAVASDLQTNAIRQQEMNRLNAENQRYILPAAIQAQAALQSQQLQDRAATDRMREQTRLQSQLAQQEAARDQRNYEQQRDDHYQREDFLDERDRERFIDDRTHDESREDAERTYLEQVKGRMAAQDMEGHISDPTTPAGAESYYQEHGISPLTGALTKTPEQRTPGEHAVVRDRASRLFGSQMEALWESTPEGESPSPVEAISGVLDDIGELGLDDEQLADSLRDGLGVTLNTQRDAASMIGDIRDHLRQVRADARGDGINGQNVMNQEMERFRPLLEMLQRRAGTELYYDTMNRGSGVSDGWHRFMSGFTPYDKELQSGLSTSEYFARNPQARN